MMRFLHAAAIAILLGATMTTSVWSGGAKWGPSDTLPFASGFLADFEAKHCYDRYWDPAEPSSAMNTYPPCQPQWSPLVCGCSA